MPLPAVTAIILHWNHADETLQCLASLHALDYPNLRILVVDNGSQEDPTPQIHAAYLDQEILATGQNLGFTGGNNAGIRHALQTECDYVWLLNDDVTLAPDSLFRLIEAAQAEPQAGFLAPIIYTREDPHRVLSSGGILVDGWRPEHRTDLDLTHSPPPDFLFGCALLVSRKVIQAVGMLYEPFFVYHEDVEWCYRGHQAGFKVLSVPQAAAWHPDTHARDENSAFVTYYMARNSLTFLRMYHLRGTLQRAILQYLRTYLSWTLRPKWRHLFAKRRALGKALYDYSLNHMGKADLN